MSEEQEVYGSPPVPCREKYWSEIDANAKIERIRDHVKMLIVQLEDAQRLVEKLMNHHHAGGEVCSRINQYGGPISSRLGQTLTPHGDDVYF